MEHDQGLHPNQIPCMKIAQVHQLVQQHRFPMVGIVVLRQDNGTPPAERNLFLPSDDQTITAILPHRAMTQQTPHAPQGKQKEQQRNPCPDTIEREHPSDRVGRSIFLHRRKHWYGSRRVWPAFCLECFRLPFLRQPGFNPNHRTLPRRILRDGSLHTGQHHADPCPTQQQQTVGAKQGVAPETQSEQQVKHCQAKRGFKQVKQESAHHRFIFVVCFRCGRSMPLARRAASLLLPQMLTRHSETNCRNTGQ